MGFLKFFVAILALLAGVFFLALGLGADLPAVKFKDFKAQSVPIGIAFLVFGVAIAKFWTIATESKHTVTSEEMDALGGIRKRITEITETVKKLSSPRGPDL